MSSMKLLRTRRDHVGRQEGFTLIELLVVVVIIGILIAIAIPLYLNYQKSSHDKASDSDVRNAVVVMENCFTQSASQQYPASVGPTDGSQATITWSTGCGDTINLSPGTEMQVLTASDGSTYKICAHNTSGHDSAWYNYDSAAGGSVASGTESACTTAPSGDSSGDTSGDASGDG